MSPLFILIAVTVLVSAAVIISAITSPLARRIGFRNVFRRLGNTLLVIIGSMVGAALISGSLVLGDSLDASFLKSVEENVGEIDVTMSFSAVSDTPSGFTVIDQEEREQIEDLVAEETDGVLPGLLYNSSPVKLDEEGEALINAFNIEIRGIQAEDITQFGANPQDLPEITEDNGAIVSQSLADKLELEDGDTVRVPYGEEGFEITVEEIVPNQGIIGTDTIIVRHTFLEQQLGLEEGSYNFVYFSAPGGVEPDNYSGERFQENLEEALAEFNSESVEFSLNEVKEDALSGFGLSFFVNAFLVLSLFGIFAGMLLIVNLYSMLAQERKYEMGILRAIALSRSQLSKTFVYEGFVYSIFSSLLGSLVGLGLGYLLAVTFSGLFRSVLAIGDNEDILDIVFAFEIDSLLIGFCAGTLITLITAIVSSVRISQLNIVSAIRNIPEEKVRKITWKWFVINAIALIILLISGGLIAGSYQVSDTLVDVQEQAEEGNPLAEFTAQEIEDLSNVVSGYMIYIGYVLAILAIALIIVRVYKLLRNSDISRLAYSTAAINVMVFTATYAEIEEINLALEQDAGIGIFFISSLALVIAFSVLVSFNLSILSNAINALFGWIPKITPVIRVAMRYPAANRSRTGITLTMFALIIYLIVFISINKALVNDQLDRSTADALGGYSLLVIPGDDLGQEQIKEVEDIVSQQNEVTEVQSILATPVLLPDYLYGDLEEREVFGPPQEVGDADDPFRTTLDGLPSDFILEDLAPLAERSEDFASDEEAWQALVDNPNYLILGEAYSADDGFGARPDIEVGETITISDVFSDSEQEKTVIGLVENNNQSPEGTFYSNIVTTNDHIITSFSEDYVDTESQSTILARIADDVDTTAVVNELKKELIDYNISSILELSEILGAVVGFINGLFLLLQGFLAFGLVVGTSGLAIIMTRSVQERRQQIGMLRSLGWQRSQVLTSFFIESTFITLLGIVIGVSMGIVGVDSLTEVQRRLDPEFSLIIPWGEIILICLLVYVWAILFALLPSIKASRLSPVEATNYPE
jgi:putative ABC transport system permease protein